MLFKEHSRAFELKRIYIYSRNKFSVFLFSQVLDWCVRIVRSGHDLIAAKWRCRTIGKTAAGTYRRASAVNLHCRKKSASGQCVREEVRSGEGQRARVCHPRQIVRRRACGPRAFISKLSPEIARIFVLIHGIRSNVYIAPTWNPWRRDSYIARERHRRCSSRRHVRACVRVNGRNQAEPRKFAQSLTNIVIR